MSRFASPSLNALKAYTPGEQPKFAARLVKLNTNELPYPPHESVREAVTDEVLADLRLYPDPTGSALKEKLAALYGVDSSEIYLANGSDDILYFAFLAYCLNGSAAFCDVTYGFYRVFADLIGCEKEIVALKEDYTVDIDALCRTKGTVFLANPNAPTGIALGLGEIERLVCSRRERVVVIDEAYVDFGAESALGLLKQYDNLLVVRTFSKSRALAGARLGYAFASREIVSDLERIRYSTNPYNINRLTLLLGEKSLDAEPYYQDCMRRIADTREQTRSALLTLGFSVTDSRANFLFARHENFSAEKLYRTLRARGILVRYFDEPRCRDFLRISVGTPEEMALLVGAIQEILKERT